MKTLIRELKRDLPQEKQKIVELMVAQIELLEEQLNKVRTDTHYLEQMRLIDEMEEKAA